MCLSFHSTDDENIEYPVAFEASYAGAWSVLVTATVLACVVCISGSVYMAVYSNSRKSKLDDYDDQQALNP